MSTLKPCPFCGKMPEVADDGVCRCNNKSCSMAPYWYLPKYWNIRPIEDALNARIAELDAEVTKGHELQDAYCDRIAELEAECDRAKAIVSRLRDFLFDYTSLKISNSQDDRWWALVDKFDELTTESEE